MITNSTSKIRKIKQIRKNRIENGNRELLKGLNPHSKGLYFSLLENNFIPTLIPNKKTTVDKITKINENINPILI